MSCAREYTAKRAVDQTAGLTKADYLKACLAGQRTSADSEPAGAARDADTDLAKKTENPIADLISVPFNNYSTFNYGGKGTFNLLEIQPVIPIHLTPDWNVITRTVVPVVWTPDLSPIPTVPVGIAPTDFSAFLTLKNETNGWLWGRRAIERASPTHRVQNTFFEVGAPMDLRRRELGWIIVSMKND